LILASKSPRRQALLRQIGLPFRVHPAAGEEQVDSSLPPPALVQQLARQKAEDVAREIGTEELILAADTIVVLEDSVLGKPGSPAEAAQMLRALSGRSHLVYTGFCLLQGSRCITDEVHAAVHFRPLTDREIQAYVQTGEPMDKAGAYGIQEMGALFVSHIEGDFYTVMGLPLCRLAQRLSAFGVFPLGGPCV
ncbi:MAG: septum formation inhibitor Maf, partial [Oscillospiraceae bacterium]|nr:septum formation inhibitor Maf [Oscillospiraceae bacterium]